MIEYTVTDYKGQPHRYGLSYSDLEESYQKFKAMSDEEFMKELPQVAHFACFVSWVKERGQYACSDTGIVHELIHVMALGMDNTRTLKSLRKQFNKEMKL